MQIVGIDEVGRGCLAGPLVAAAVILKQPINGLKDSKKLTKKQREALSIEIKDKARSYGIGAASAEEIDSLGLTKATSIAMTRALKKINVAYDKIIIDGNINFLSGNNKVETLIKADDLIPEVSAASIIAKVYRDNYMSAMAKEYPDYGFDKHVGYGTKVHLDKIKQFGLTSIHRKSIKLFQGV